MPRDRLLTRPFVLVSVANLFQGMSFFLFVHLPRFLGDLGADETGIGLLVGITAVAAISARPFLGRVMDTRGRRPIIVAGGILNLIGILLYLTVTSLGPWLYVVRIVHGLAEAAMFTGLFTYGADAVPASRRTEGLALFGVSGLLPIALGGLIGDAVLTTWGFDALFLTAAAFGAVSLVLGSMLREIAARTPAHRRSSFLAAIRQRDLLPIWWIAGTFSLVLTGYFTFLRTYVDETGIGSVGSFFAFYAGTAIALRLAFAWVPARIGEKRTLYPALGSLAAGFIVLAQAGSGADVAVAGVLCGIGHGYAFPILYGFTVTRSPLQVRGSTLAFFTALFDIGTLIGGPILGTIIKTSGYTAMYLTSGILLVAATAVYARWDRDWRLAPSLELA
jgi:MFS family permease